MPILETSSPAFTHALAEVRPVLDSLPSDRLETIRVDAIDAVMRAVGVARNVATHKDAVRAALGESSSVHFDRLESAARAFGRAHADHLILLHGKELEVMTGALNDTRALLLHEAQSLVHKKHLSSSLLAELVGGTSYRGMALDVLQLTAVFRKEWAAVEAHTTVTMAELDQAEGRANEVITTIGENNEADSSSSPSAELRRRAYTYFVQTYDEVRRAIVFVRWKNGDADDIAPSLFAGRARRSEDDDTTVTPIAPIASPTPAAPPVPPGMPGGSPFVS